MNSKIFIGETWHHRLAVKSHNFRYRMYFFGIDLAELEGLRSRTVAIRIQSESCAQHLG